jgi:hypothetical protein
MIAMEGQFRSWGRSLIDSSDVRVLFACGRGLWVVYGMLQKDIIISAACCTHLLEATADSRVRAPAGVVPAVRWNDRMSALGHERTFHTLIVHVCFSAGIRPRDAIG